MGKHTRLGIGVIIAAAVVTIVGIILLPPFRAVLLTIVTAVIAVIGALLALVKRPG